MYHRLTSQAELDIYEIMRHFSKIYKVSEKFSHLEKNFQPYKKFFFSLRVFLNSCGNLQVKTQRTGLLPLLSLTYVLLLAHSGIFG